MLLKIRKKLT